MIKAFVFDIGDCIEPSTKFKIESLKELMQKYKLPESFVSTYLEMDKYHKPHMFHAQGDFEIMKRTLQELKLNYNVEDLLREMQSLFWEKLDKYYNKERLGEKFVKVVNFLKNNHYQVAILSDNSFEAKRKYLNLYKRLGLEFDAFVVSAEVGVKKPSRKVFQTLLDKLGIKPEETVYFGNNLERDAAAKDYGWDFVWVYGFTKVLILKNTMGRK